MQLPWSTCSLRLRSKIGHMLCTYLSPNRLNLSLHGAHTLEKGHQDVKVGQAVTPLTSLVPLPPRPCLGLVSGFGAASTRFLLLLLARRLQECIGCGLTEFESTFYTLTYPDQ